MCYLFVTIIEKSLSNEFLSYPRIFMPGLKCIVPSRNVVGLIIVHLTLIIKFCVNLHGLYIRLIALNIDEIVFISIHTTATLPLK